MNIWDWMALAWYCFLALTVIAVLDAAFLVSLWGWGRWRSRGRCACGRVRVRPEARRWHPSDSLSHSRVMCAPVREMIR